MGCASPVETWWLRASLASRRPICTADRPPTVDLSLGPADVFDVRVYGEPELSSTYRVANDGSTALSP